MFTRLKQLRAVGSAIPVMRNAPSVFYHDPYAVYTGGGRRTDVIYTIAKSYSSWILDADTCLDLVGYAHDFFVRTALTTSATAVVAAVVTDGNV